MAWDILLLKYSLFSWNSSSTGHPIFYLETLAFSNIFSVFQACLAFVCLFVFYSRWKQKKLERASKFCSNRDRYLFLAGEQGDLCVHLLLCFHGEWGLFRSPTQVWSLSVVAHVHFLFTVISLNPSLSVSVYSDSYPCTCLHLSPREFPLEDAA